MQAFNAELLDPKFGFQTFTAALRVTLTMMANKRIQPKLEYILHIN